MNRNSVQTGPCDDRVQTEEELRRTIARQEEEITWLRMQMAQLRIERDAYAELLMSTGGTR